MSDVGLDGADVARARGGVTCEELAQGVHLHRVPGHRPRPWKTRGSMKGEVVNGDRLINKDKSYRSLNGRVMYRWMKLWREQK